MWLLLFLRWKGTDLPWALRLSIDLRLIVWFFDRAQIVCYAFIVDRNAATCRNRILDYVSSAPVFLKDGSVFRHFICCMLSSLLV